MGPKTIINKRKSGSTFKRDAQDEAALEVHNSILKQKMKEEYEALDIDKKCKGIANYKNASKEMKLINMEEISNYSNEKKINKFTGTKKLFRDRHTYLQASLAAVRRCMNIFCRNQIGKITLVLLLCFPQGVQGDKYSCPLSSQTRQAVASCPQNKTEWDRAAMNKRCMDINQNCTEKSNFQYHCLFDKVKGVLVEVCATKKYMIGGYCAVYDDVGKQVIEWYGPRCKTCPSSYSSTEAYKYTDCYSIHKTTFNLTTWNDTRTYKATESTPLPEEQEESILQVLSIVGCVALSALTISFVILGYKKRDILRQCKMCHKQEKEQEGQVVERAPLQGNQV